MSEKLTMIKELYTKARGWTIQAMVVEKGLPKMTTNNKIYQKHILIDSEGTKIQATIFGASDIEVLKHTLKLFHTYAITNAAVHETPEKFRLFDDPYQLYLYARTPIEETTVEKLNIKALNYNFVPLADLEEYCNDEKDVDVLFAILHVAPRRRTTKCAQNVLVIDQSMVPRKLALWDQFIDQEGEMMTKLQGPYPIVIGARLKVKDYNGVQLGTHNNTIFTFDPPLPQANALYKWCMAHSDEIKKFPINQLNQMGAPATPTISPTRKQIKKISQLPTLVSKPELHWIQSWSKVANLKQRFWCMSCSKCNLTTDATANAPFWCNFCKEKVQPTPRCKFNIELSDSTKTITATIFTPVAESMFRITPQYLKDNTYEGVLSLEATEKLTKAHEYAVRVRAYKYVQAEPPYCLFNVHAYDLVSNIRDDDDMITPCSSKNLTDSSPSKKARRQVFDTESSSQLLLENDESTTSMQDDDIGLESPTVAFAKKND